jgi:hypothetical protein
MSELTSNQVKSNSALAYVWGNTANMPLHHVNEKRN